MEISKQTRRHLMEILAFAILFYCGVQNFGLIIKGFQAVVGIVMPFLIGAVIAFIFNVPMKLIEKHLPEGKQGKSNRGLAYVLTLLFIIGIIVIALVVVIPELGNTIMMLVKQIPVALAQMQVWLEGLSKQWPALEPAIAELNIDWASISETAVGFVQSMASSLVSSGVGFFSGVANGLVTFVIAFTFSIYLLLQKEKLGSQAKQIMYALFPDKVTERVLMVAGLSNRIFSSFLSGQCLEAVILGCLFVVAMTVFRMPYAMLIGIVIAITALIPMIGAFIGCVIGMLLIVTVNPMQAIWFLVLFLVIQQLEGNLIYPHVVGGSIGLPSIWVLAAVTIGGNTFGVVGIIVFIPLCSVIYTLFRGYIKGRLGKKNVPEYKWKTNVVPKQTEEE